MKPADTTTTTYMNGGGRRNRRWFQAREITKYFLLASALTMMVFHQGYLLLSASIGGGGTAFVPSTTRARAMSDLSFKSSNPYRDPTIEAPETNSKSLLESSKEEEEEEDAGDDERHEQQEQLLPKSELKEESQIDQQEHSLLKDMPRNISLIHVGKAGGMTLRTATALQCSFIYKNNTGAVNRCIQSRFKPDNKLSYQTRIYCHVWDCSVKRFENSTSFLLPLRNPVDRVISTYRYSHPENCNEVNNKTSTRPKGCHNAKDRDKGKHTSAYRVFSHCFPLPGVEDFAQASLSPWVSITQPSGEANLTEKEEWRCRKIARDLLQRKSKDRSAMSMVAPHMFYNYEYYASKSLWEYPDKEVFGIRTEHEWDDMVELDKMLGGPGNFTNEGKSISHGSEHYAPSPISTEAYHKLCCVLEHEIEIYLEIMSRVENLSEEQKLESTDKLRNKCGVDVSWAKWRSTCRKRLEEDGKVFKDHDVGHKQRLGHAELEKAKARREMLLRQQGRTVAQ